MYYNVLTLSHHLKLKIYVNIALFPGDRLGKG